MSGQFGTENIEKILTLLKLGTIAVLQAVAKDGFQPQDLGAFLKSSEFEKAIAPALEGAPLVPSEVSELDMMDYIHLAKYGYAVIDDILTEAKLAAKKINP